MRSLLRMLGLTSLLAFAAWGRAEEPMPLTILYAGHPGTDREKDFAGFLEQHFRKVDRVSLERFTDAKAAGYDVVVFDWDSVYPRNADGTIHEPIERLLMPRRAKLLSESYDRPTVVVGAGGQHVIRHLRLKLDYLCICLGPLAHGIAAGHEVFRSPYPVELPLEDHPTPPRYRGLTSGRPLGKSLKVWRVQTKGFPEIDPGIVSSAWDFEASPDAELIASGVSSKTPDSVALGRQGNYFLWGFSASPRDMTPEARKCFVNVVCYIKKFAGQRPLVRKDAQDVSRDWALMYAYSQRERSDDRAGAEKHIAWVRDNYEWLRPGGWRQIAVDEDARALGFSNRKVESLDAWIRLLEQKERSEVALRLLKRYTAERFEAADSWRNWLDANRDRLFFDEVGGFVFRVAPQGLIAPLRLPRTPLSTLEPTQRLPVAAEAELEPGSARAGGEVTLVLRVVTAPGWHITAVQGSRGSEVATSLDLKLPESFEAEGGWTLPEPRPAAGGRLTYDGSFEFRCRLRVALDAPAGTAIASCTLRYQACDTFSCRPPDQATLQAKAEVVGR
jgi:Disulphide bond corrector protein DsbC